jgi:hypothetical protein
LPNRRVPSRTGSHAMAGAAIAASCVLVWVLVVINMGVAFRKVRARVTHTSDVCKSNFEGICECPTADA